MYKSVISDRGEFLVIIDDGVFSEKIFELPTEKLADKVAFELQLAWEDGKEYGSSMKWKELDPNGFHSKISKWIKKDKSLGLKEQEAYYAKIEHRQKREEKVRKGRIWQSVLSWKKNNFVYDDSQDD